MLEIKTVDESPAAGDYVFIFAKDNAVVSLQRPPDQFWLRHEAEQAFGDVGVGAPLGYWAGRPSYVVEVESQGLNAMEHLSGNLYSLFGRVPDAVFAAYGRALQMLSWKRDHRFCGRCGARTSPPWISPYACTEPISTRFRCSARHKRCGIRDEPSVPS